MDDVRYRFFKVFEHLKEINKIKSQDELSKILGTNKAGISDLKHGRKKISLENIISMINSYPEININYILFSHGSIFNESKEIDSNEKYIIQLQKDKIENLEKEIKRLKKANKTSTGYMYVAEPPEKLIKEEEEND